MAEQAAKFSDAPGDTAAKQPENHGVLSSVIDALEFWKGKSSKPQTEAAPLSLYERAERVKQESNHMLHEKAGLPDDAPDSQVSARLQQKVLDQFKQDHGESIEQMAARTKAEGLKHLQLMSGTPEEQLAARRDSLRIYGESVEQLPGSTNHEFRKILEEMPKSTLDEQITNRREQLKIYGESLEIPTKNHEFRKILETAPDQPSDNGKGTSLEVPTIHEFRKAHELIPSVTEGESIHRFSPALQKVLLDQYQHEQGESIEQRADRTKQRAAAYIQEQAGLPKGASEEQISAALQQKVLDKFAKQHNGETVDEMAARFKREYERSN